MSWSDHYRRYARYNRWQNRQLTAACAQLSNEQLAAPCGLFFASLLGNWNHLLVTDLLWLKRLAQIFPLPEELQDLPTPTALDQILVHNQQQLQPLRARLDDLIIRWCDLLRADDIHTILQYTNSYGEAKSQSLDRVLQHLFNHQTHHRGQITAALSQHGVDYGVTDLLFMPAEDDI